MIALVAMMFGFLHTTNAQDNNDRAARRQEMQARQTERLIRDLKLTDEQKEKFMPIYERYLNELAATRTQQNRDRQTEIKKDMTDAEATAKLNEQFARQAEQIQQQQLRLDIQKKYCAEFSSVLTPQQLLQVFQPVQMNNRQGQQGGRGNRGGFGGGGPRGGFGGGGGFGGPGGGFGGGDF